MMHLRDSVKWIKLSLNTLSTIMNHNSLCNINRQHKETLEVSFFFFRLSWTALLCATIVAETLMEEHLQKNTLMQRCFSKRCQVNQFFKGMCVSSAWHCLTLTWQGCCSSWRTVASCCFWGPTRLQRSFH